MIENEIIRNGLFDRCIIENMSEGVITFDKAGKMISINKAAENMLDKSADELLGKSFTNCFIDLPNNDNFNQIFIDAIYDPESVKESFVTYDTGDRVKQFRILASYLRQENEASGVILVLSDMTELYDLRDAARAMNEINRLNAKLEERNEVLQKTFGRFLSDEIVHDLLSKPDGLSMGGKKEKLSILMSDLRGFTALSERMDAKDLLDMLNHYLGVMTDKIQKHRGTIIEFIGDGIMVIFGAPHHFDDHATEAVAAAVEMQHAMEEVNAWNLQRGFPALNMGIGLNLGDVIVGNIGSEKRTKYGVAGKEVNLCGRIESFTVGGEILISQSILDACSCDVTVTEKREVVPKGAKQPMTVYSITGLGAPYNLTCEHRNSDMHELKSEYEISFFKLQDKNILSTDNQAFITKISNEGCMLRTDTELDLFDNVVINISEGLYGKVLKKNEDECLIRFTSCPRRFEGFLNDLIGAK